MQGGLLGPRFLTHLGGAGGGEEAENLPTASSPSTQLDAVALNLYYKKAFLKAEVPAVPPNPV